MSSPLTQQYSNSISPKASLSYAFEDPAKFSGFGTNARINASLTQDYASSVASLTTGQLSGNVALINGTIQPGAGFVPATWTSTQTYEEWRGRIDLQTDFIVGRNAVVSPRLGVTFLERQYRLQPEPASPRGSTTATPIR